MLDIKRVLAAAPKTHEDDVLQPLTTPWGEALDPENVLPEHPRPQFARPGVKVLNGWWDFTQASYANAGTQWRSAEPPQHFDTRILVPFSPEAALSGVNRILRPDELAWYRTTVTTDGLEAAEGARILLHFDAVDYACAVYCNGMRVGTHVGGYLPFSFDITDHVGTGSCEVTLCAYDPTEEGTQLRGKQTLERGNIWYTPQSGIWKTVWLEAVPECHIASATFDGDPSTGILHTEVQVEGIAGSLKIVMRNADGETVGSAQALPGAQGQTVVPSATMTDIPHAATIGATPSTTCTFDIAVDNAHAWTPDDPYLYSLELSYGADRITSYCAFRDVKVAPDSNGVVRVLLNGQPIAVRGVLDQGYWPDGLMTAPAEEALAFDIAQMKRLGFNMLRKHIKIESERWYYLCDKMGMLVFQDMVSGGGRYDANHTSRIPTLWKRSWTHHGDGEKNYAQLSAQDESYRREWMETCLGAVALLRNHPCIVSWVLFNEGWGQFDAREACEAVRNADPTRPIDATSGWYDQRCGNYFSIHNYFRPLEVFTQPKDAPEPRAFALSEFGGITYHVDGHSSLERAYGYDSFDSADGWKHAVIDVLARAEALEADGQAVSVYTQLSDIEEETNGILTYDRRINKFDL